MRAPARRRRRHPPCTASGSVSSSPTSAPSPTAPGPSAAPLARMPPSPTATPPSSPPTDHVRTVRGGPHVASKPLEEPSPSSSSSVSVRLPVVETTPTASTRQGTKRPRSPMCRRGSSDAGDGRVVALAPRTAIKPTAPGSSGSDMTRSLAFAAASASAHVNAQAQASFRFGLDGHTVRARVQRLLVQFVMLPVVWVSLCCVVTAAMGIEAMESIQKALLHDEQHALEQPPTKKPKRTTASDPLVRLPRRAEMPPPSDEECGLVAKLKPHLATATAVPESGHATRRRRRVLIWDLDETLVLFASLYSGNFARAHDKDLATSVVLGEQMMTYLLAVLERHFFFSDLHNADIDHISCVSELGEAETDRIRAVADRYARIRAIYERRGDGQVDFLDDPSSQWFIARQALVASIDMLSMGWISEARDLLARTQTPLTPPGVDAEAASNQNDEMINVMVTNTQLSPALCKCLIYGLDKHFPIESVYSSSKLHKLRCFQTIMAKYTSQSCYSDVEFVAIGDGPEEEQVSHALGIRFIKIRSLDDLRQLRHDLQLVETAAPTSVTIDTSSQPTTTPVGTPPNACTASAP